MGGQKWLWPQNFGRRLGWLPRWHMLKLIWCCQWCGQTTFLSCVLVYIAQTNMSNDLRLLFTYSSSSSYIYRNLNCPHFSTAKMPLRFWWLRRLHSVCYTDIKRCIAFASIAMRSFDRICKDCRLTIRTKSRLHQILAVSFLRYLSETWTLLDAH